MTDDDNEAMSIELTLAAASVLGLPIEVPAVSTSDRVRALNDASRLYGIGGRVMLTRSIADLDDAVRRHVIRAVRLFDSFDNSNDPHHEHDCAILEVDGLRVMFKIDYYDRDFRFHSPDPSDPEVTLRLLTVMMADDY